MTLVPHFLLRRMYVSGSLCATAHGVSFQLQNVLGPGHITRFEQVSLNGTVYAAAVIRIALGNAEGLSADSLSDAAPLAVTMGAVATCEILGASLPPGRHQIQIAVVTREAGAVSLTVDDDLGV